MPHIDRLFLLNLIFLIINAIAMSMRGSQRGAETGWPRARGLSLAGLGHSLLRVEERELMLSYCFVSHFPLKI